MPITATTVAFGPPALDALAAAVRSAKDGDPLRPVTVIVATNTTGVMARRALGRRGGAAAVDVSTLYRVAEQLGAPSLLAEGRKPVSTPVVDLAVKQVIARSPGLYQRVKRHPSTVVALRDLYRQLRVAGPMATTALARTARGREPARVAAEVARRLSVAWYDEGDLLARAAACARDQLPDRLRRVVVHLPARLRNLEVQLLVALGQQAAVELVVGLTGHATADAAVVGLVSRLTGGPCPPLAPPPETGASIDVVSTTDADDEVRLAVRAVLEGARSGTPFDRMAILWPGDRPYARLVEHQLTAAGVPWNGRPGTGTDERMVPRVLADLLQLDRRGLRRTALMTLLGDVPARDSRGRPVPTVRWERIGRRAGIIREDDWDSRLPEAMARASGSSDAEPAAELARFVAELRAALGSPDDERSWSTWVTWSHDRLERWFGRRGLDRLDGAEREAWERTQKVLDRLAHLDSLGPPVTRAEFRTTFMAELDVTPARHAKVGDGVHVGALTEGLDVDLVVLVGGADGLLPPPPAIDPLLGDRDRLAAGLVDAAERAARAHRHFLASVTTTRDVLVTVPRGDLRATASHHPSRWLDELGRTGAVRSWRVVDSHAHGLMSTEFPVSAAEHRRRQLWAWVRGGHDLRAHALAADDAVLHRALRLGDARAGVALTAYDGDLSGVDLAVTGPSSAPVSPSRIEQWARCPHAYFVRYVLGVRPLDEPEDIETVTPLDRGSALHAAIDRLQQAVLGGDLPPPPRDGWTDEHRVALQRIGAEVADELEASGRTGRRATWANERPALLAELDRWITADGAQWHGRTILSSEQAFGREHPVEIALADGRRVAFFGQIDRVDQLPGGELVVTDHKTGKADSLSKLSIEDPTMGATRFQLPVYAAAAAGLTGHPRRAVRAEYAFFDRGNFRRIGFTFDDAVWSRVVDDLTLVVDGIEAGYFPATPEPPAWRPYVDCAYCEPDRLGTGPRWSEWTRKRHDPRLQRWFAEPAEVRT